MYTDRRFKIVKMSVFPNLIHKHNHNKNPTKLFCGYWQTVDIDSNVYVERQKNRIANSLLKNKVGRWHYLTSRHTIRLQESRQYGIDERTSRLMEQNTEPRNNPCKHSQLITDKGTKAIQWSRDSLFNKWCWNNCTSTWKKERT